MADHNNRRILMGLKKQFATYLFCLLFASLLCAQDGHDQWEIDFDKAVKLAEDTGKDLLVDFSGSDWCGWCITCFNMLPYGNAIQG